MKRILIASLLCAVLLLSACSTIINKDGNDGYVAEACESNTVNSLEAYESYIESVQKKRPPNFVPWSSLSQLGEFEAFSFNGYYDFYTYGIRDSAGHFIKIHIDHSPELSATAKKTSTVTNDMTDMYRISGKDPAAVIKRGSYEYCYSYGSLDYIDWYADGIHFRLVGFWGSYPEGFTNTHMMKVLSINEAEANAAFAEITKNLATK